MLHLKTRVFHFQTSRLCCLSLPASMDAGFRRHLLTLFLVLLRDLPPQTVISSFHSTFERYARPFCLAASRLSLLFPTRKMMPLSPSSPRMAPQPSFFSDLPPSPLVIQRLLCRTNSSKSLQFSVAAPNGLSSPLLSCNGDAALGGRSVCPLSPPKTEVTTARGRREDNDVTPARLFTRAWFFWIEYVNIQGS